MELRKVHSDDFELIHPLLLGFKNSQMRKEDWRKMLFDYAWADGPCRGYAMFEQGRPVGFMGTIFSRRPLLGQMERFCNLSSWIVDKDYRGPSALMMRTLADDLLDCTVVGHTPSQTSIKVFSLFGFVPFEQEQLVMPPVVTDRRALRGMGGSFTLSVKKLERALASTEAIIQRDLAGSRARGVLLTRGGAQCYLVVRPTAFRRMPVAEILYVGNPSLFWEIRALAHAAALVATGTPVLAIDKRFSEGASVPLAWTTPRRRIYRPTRPEIKPVHLDGLYSELTMLRGVDLAL